MKRWSLRSFFIGLLLLFVSLLLGAFLFSVRHFSWDYVACKYGLVRKPNLDPAFYRSLLMDRDRDALVAGLTVEQLRERFGQLRKGDAVTEYQRSYETTAAFSSWGDDHLWVQDSPWVIILKDGKGAELVLIKG